MQLHDIEVPREALARFCVENGIRKLVFFGSVLTDQFRPDSDMDVLVEFEPGRVPGLLRLVGMERELSDLLGRRVDLRTPEDLSRYFRDKVVAAALVQYERA